jgi:uncharacterized protein YsxB (DUF464 family)
MVEVTFTRDSQQRLSSFVSAGHIEIEETSSDEYSLVCAAISAILQAARLGLETHASVPLELEQRKGYMRIEWPPHARDDARVQAIAATAELAIAQLAGQYPQYVRIVRRGV